MKKLLLGLSAMLFTTMAWSQEEGDMTFFEAKTVEGSTLEYQITDISKKEVEVVKWYKTGNDGTTITIPKSVSNPNTGDQFTVIGIGPEAFSLGSVVGAGYEQHVTKIIIPSTVRNIGERAFGGKWWGLGIEIDPENPIYYMKDTIEVQEVQVDKHGIIKEFYYATYNEHPVEIGGIIDIRTHTYVWGGLSIIPCEKRTWISGNAETGGRVKMETYRRGNVESIGAFACENRNRNIRLEIPSSVKYISPSFCAMTDATEILVDKDNTVYDSRNNCNAIIRTADNVLVKGCCNTIVPNEIKAIGDFAFSGALFQNRRNNTYGDFLVPEGVVTIGDYAFANAQRLTDFEIPKGIDRIGNWTFCRMGLTSITIPDNVTSIGNGAFESNISATTLYIPDGVTSIGDDAFASCQKLDTIYIPKACKYIGKYAFRSCGNISEKCFSLEIPAEMSFIGEYAFQWANIDSLTIDNGLETMGRGAFRDCKNMEYVCVNGGPISEFAFDGCKKLHKVILGAGVESIELFAFGADNNLKEVVSFIKEPFEIDGRYFSMFYEDGWIPNTITTLYVPKGTKVKYEATADWDKFQNIVEMDDGELIELTPINDETTVALPQNTNTKNVVVGNIYYNLYGDSGYDAVEGCIIINTPTDVTAAEGEPGSYAVKDHFNGIIFMVNGKGVIEIDCQTQGSMMLCVKIGGNEPQIVTKNKRGKVEIAYDVEQPTYIYIYATVNIPASCRVAALSDCVKIWGGIIKPGAVLGISECVQNTNSTIVSYLIDGRRRQNSFAKNGLNIVRISDGTVKKIVVK